MRLEILFSKGGLAFMPYVCCGDPSEEFTLRLVESLVSNGADAIELGIPFSDPIADGKTIQGASARALKNGMSPARAIEVIARIREKTDIPICVMTYYNIVFGSRDFVKSIRDAGADGLIVPDVPLEESGDLKAECDRHGIELIYFITPGASDGRLGEIAKRCGGFLYAVAVAGITGSRDSVPQEALGLVRRMKRISSIPIVIGFGISRPEHADAYEEAGADGVIVGSRIVELYSGFPEEEALRNVAEFTRKMKHRYK
jgi:tryptophan synthase alpha chain